MEVNDAALKLKPTTVKNQRWWSLRSSHEFKKRFLEFMEVLEPFVKEKRESKGLPPYQEVMVAPGIKFMRVMIDGVPYAMVERTSGDIYKCHGRRTVCKEARGNIYADDFGMSCLQATGVKSLKLRKGGSPGHLAKPEEWVLTED